MSKIPLHLQRKFEQRWISKFVFPVVAAGRKSTDLKGIIDDLQRRQSLTKFTTGA